MKRLHLGRPCSATVVAPHPDDEAIGAWGLIRALRRRGVPVRVVVATDGAASHPNSARWPRGRLVAERRRETRTAMRAIGVAAGAVRFVGLPDGALPAIGRGAAWRLGRAMAGERGLLVLPSDRDDHPDHRVVRAIARRLPNAARRLTYLVWPDGARHRRPVVGLPLGGTLAAKRGALRRYRTQCGAITDDPGGFSISRVAMRRFTRPCEWFEEVAR